MTVRDELMLTLMGRVVGDRGDFLADNIAQSWLTILRKFSPLIGASSALLLFERSLDHHRAAFSWLPALALPAQPDAALDHLRSSMAVLPPADILDAQRAILTTFIDLMTTLIGARLTIQFLQAAFPADPAGSNTEENPA